jgi:hypothetical protein
LAAEAFFLFLDEKKQKSSQQRGLFTARGLCPANQVKPRAVIFLPCLSHGPTLQQKFTMPLPAHHPPVLPDFARSFSADEWRSNEKYCNNKKKRWPVRVRGREHGL